MSRLGESPRPSANRPKALSQSRDLVRTMGMTVLSVCLAVALAEIYALVGKMGLKAWQGALAFHAVVGGGIILIFYLKGILFRKFEFLGVGERAPGWFARKSWLAYAPAVIILVGATFLGTLSTLGATEPHHGTISSPMAWIWLVPWAEEIFFRGGIGAIYRRALPGLGGLWLSAATFALAHAGMTMENLLHGQVGLPLGPFLLGLLCESVYLLSGSLLPAIAVHASANATVAVFQLLDPRWLEWLGLLYI